MDTPEWFQAARDSAPTALDALFFGWLAGSTTDSEYLEELIITPLEGAGNEPHDFVGEL